MNDMLLQYSLFLLEGMTIVMILLVIISSIAKQKNTAQKPRLTVKPLHDKYQNYRLTLLNAIGDKKALKKAKHDFKTQQKEQKKSATPNHVFVINFQGDIMGSTVDQLSEVISAIICLGDNIHEVILNLESSGGLVHAYGLAALQLQRLRNHNIPLTVCIDKVAASGGYMMAVLANKLIAAPFALIGSIGVAAEIPNFHRLLKKHAIDYEQITAGEFKRTLSTLGEITTKGRNKLQKDINQAHDLFKNHVHKYRPQLDINAVSTGELWFGHDALERQLVDELMASHDYILNTCQHHRVFLAEINQKKPMIHKVFHCMQQALNQAKQALQQQSHDEGIIR